MNREAYGQVFNVGGDQPHTVNQLAQIVSEAMDVSPKIVYLKPRNEVRHALPSHDKTRLFFDLPAPVLLREGVSRMAKWVKRVGAHKTKEFPTIEIPKGLPEGW